MQLPTQIKFNLTIGDISAIYSKNFEAMLLQQAKNAYERTCMDQQYILSIDSIVERSLPNLIRRDLDAKIRVFITVEATVLRFDQYDVVANMRVNKIIPRSKIGPNDLLECSNAYCRALIKLDDNLPSFSVGDIIPIKVGAALLKIENKQVLINAYPFVPHRAEKVAYLVPKLSSYDCDTIVSTLVSLLESKRARYQETMGTHAERMKFFAQLLYPFKKMPKKSGGNLFDVVAFLSDINKHQGKYLLIDQMVDLTEQKVRIVEQEELTDTALVNSPMFASIAAYTFVKHLDLLCDLSVCYAAQDVFDRHQYVWDLYAQNKLN